MPGGKNEDQQRYRIAALAKGIDVLKAIAEAGKPVRLTEIASTLTIPTPTLFRLATTLEAEGLVERDADGAYRPALAVLRLGFATLRASGLVTTAEPTLKQLSVQTSETVNMGVLMGDRVLYVVRLRNQELVTAHVEVGSTLPAASTSIGKVLLAALDPADVRDIITTTSLEQSTGPRAPKSADELDERLAAVRNEGFAIQDEEVAAGLRSIAAPIINGDGKVVAGVNISVPAGRHTVQQLRERFLGPLLAATGEISSNLGHSPL